jgi:acyl carrier protein
MARLIMWDDFAARISEYTGIEIEKISKETNIFSDLGMDSLGLFSLGMFLIKIYETKIPLSAVATLETAGDIFEIINKINND